MTCFFAKKGHLQKLKLFHENKLLSIHIKY